MSDLLWPQLAKLQPSLPQHIEFQRRHYQGETWYLLQDKTSGRFHRLNGSAYRLLSFMNGRNSLQTILAAASAPEFYEQPEDAPTRAELVHLVQYLHVADLLLCDMPPSTQELFTRQQLKHKQRWQRLLVNPLTWKIPLGSPDRLLDFLLPLARLLATPFMGVIWLCLLGYSLLVAAQHWPELTHGQLDHLLSPGNLFLLWLTYPLLKLLHELGHGLFTKVWGGEVQEWGLVFILGTPLPYVDATAATGFATKSRRLMVSAAGMAVELFIAALALLLWVQVEDGLLRDTLFNIMVIGSVSTLFFNGNPLMRFDGYHLLGDACDLPNLAARANQQLSYSVNRYLYGVAGLVSPAASRAEGVFLVSYALAAFVYRLFILVVIVRIAASYFPTLGLLLAIWLIFIQLLWPALNYCLKLIKGKSAAGPKTRAVKVVSGALGVLLLFLLLVPLPRTTSGEGVVWLPDDANIKARADGEVVQLMVQDGEAVEQGQLLIQLRNNTLEANLRTKQAVLREYNARYQKAWAEDRAEAQLLVQDIAAIEAELGHLQLQVSHLQILSPAAGHFRRLQHYELVGSYVHYGDRLGIIDKPEQVRVRAALTQEEIGAVRQATQAIDVKFASQSMRVYSATLIEQVPAGTFELPSVVLGAQGGGRLAIDTRVPEGTKSAHMIFVVDLAVTGLQSRDYFGDRVYIQFHHPLEPALIQLFRILEQLFIRGFQI